MKDEDIWYPLDEAHLDDFIRRCDGMSFDSQGRLVVQDYCIIWKGVNIEKPGAAVFFDGTRNRYAARLAWELFHGKPIAGNGTQLRRQCGDPLCVSPRCHTLGEIRFKSNKATLSQGVKNFSAKLNEDDVRNCRDRFAADPKCIKQLAAEYDVSQTTIWKACKRKTWRHLK